MATINAIPFYVQPVVDAELVLAGEPHVVEAGAEEQALPHCSWLEYGYCSQLIEDDWCLLFGWFEEALKD